MERESCITCKFQINQSCRKHSPISVIRINHLKEPYVDAEWPPIIDVYSTWCGDWEVR